MAARRYKEVVPNSFASVRMRAGMQLIECEPWHCTRLSTWEYEYSCRAIYERAPTMY
jgi:hypothetical protein